MLQPTAFLTTGPISTKILVQLEFAASGRGTRVTLEHRGWVAIRGDHPVRHGKPSSVFLGELGMWWAGLLRSLSERAAGHGD